MFSEIKISDSLSITAWNLISKIDELGRFVDLVYFYNNSQTHESFSFTYVTSIQLGHHYRQASEADYHISLEVNVFYRRQTVKVSYSVSVETVFSLGCKICGQSLRLLTTKLIWAAKKSLHCWEKGKSIVLHLVYTL